MSGPRPSENGALDLTRAAMVQPGANRLRNAARDGTLLMRFTATNRHNLVWGDPFRADDSVPGPALEMTNTSFELAGRWPGLMLTVGPDFRADLVVRRSRHGHGYPGAAASAGGRDDAGPVSPGRWRSLFFVCGRHRNSEIYDWPATDRTGGRKLVAG